MFKTEQQKLVKDFKCNYNRFYNSSLPYLTRLINFFVKFIQMIPGAKKFNFRYPILQNYQSMKYTFFFNTDFLQQEVNHCLQTNRHHPYCICAFLNESFAISKVYHYTYTMMLWSVDPILPLLSCREVNHTGDFCLPFSVHSLKHLSVGPLSNFHCVEILKEIVYLSKSNVSLWCTYSLRYIVVALL